jgi:hypothetical protein
MISSAGTLATLVLSGLLRILVTSEEPPVVNATRDLAADCERVFGRPAQVVTTTSAGGANITLSIDPLLTGPEAWRVAVDSSGVRITGSDALGLVFGIYTFSERCLGVDPLWFWKGMPPERRARVSIEPQTFASAPAKFRYRGWFINDEDLLTEFGTSGGRRFIEYPFYSQVIDFAMAERIYEALLRLGGNLIIPASFADVMNAPEAELIKRAVARGLYVTQHHVEPLGVSHFGFENFWRARGERKEFRYSTDPDAVRTAWRAFAEKWRTLAGDQVVWQLGLRGRGDRPIWANDKAIVPETAGDFISRAIAEQWTIVRSVDPRPEPPATITLWAEGSELMATGRLTFPPGITVVFADRGPLQEMRHDFDTFAPQREYRYGAYYHVAFWTLGPHLVQGVSAHRVHRLFERLQERGATHYAIVNVSNVREHVLGAHTFIRTALHGAERPIERTLDEFAPAATRPFMDAFHGALLRRPDGVWQQDGDCVQAVIVFLRAKNRVDGVAAVRKLIDPEATDQAATKLEKVKEAAELDMMPERWRAWTREYFVIQADYLAALYRAVAALARDQPAEAAAHIARSLEIRAPLAAGPWAGWYAGDKKANWPDILQRLNEFSRQTAAAKKE